jgi:hypothetical protein
MTEIKAIETEYAGYRFRSRAEARWAVFLEALEVKWSYELEGYALPSGWYLPDFFLTMRPEEYDAQMWPGAGQWLEIKGTEPTDAELLLLGELAVHTKHTSHLAVGPPAPDALRYCAHYSTPVARPPAFPKCPQDPEVLQLMIHFSRFSPFGMDERACERALRASRSARFEHGSESPRSHAVTTTTHRPDRLLNRAVDRLEVLEQKSRAGLLAADEVMEFQGLIQKLSSPEQR